MDRLRRRENPDLKAIMSPKNLSNCLSKNLWNKPGVVPHLEKSQPAQVSTATETCALQSTPARFCRLIVSPPTIPMRAHLPHSIDDMPSDKTPCVHNTALSCPLPSRVPRPAMAAMRATCGVDKVRSFKPLRGLAEVRPSVPVQRNVRNRPARISDLGERRCTATLNSVWTKQEAWLS